MVSDERWNENSMSINVTGTIERKEMGTGTWALIADNGTTYEIFRGVSKDLLKPGQKVSVVGQVKEDIMTLAMIGPVLEVQSFDVIS